MKVKIAVIVLLSFASVGLVLFTDNSTVLRVRAYSSGPPAGYTRAPGEPFDCSDCHTPQAQSSGTISLNAPSKYTLGQTYNITVTHATTDQTRVRWGFELTALDAADQRAGSLTPLDSFTQVISGQGSFPARQYIEHTSAGTFFGQHNGASWTFQWTAPSQDVGTITFYLAGNQANGDGNSSGDKIYFTFVASLPDSPLPPQLLEESGPNPNRAAALDAVLLVRDPFHVKSIAPWFNPGSDQNTRLMVFAANLPAGSVTVNLVDANNQSFDVTAEDVRSVAASDFSQITFRLPNLAAGTCTVTVKVGSLVSNAGTMRIVP